MIIFVRHGLTNDDTKKVPVYSGWANTPLDYKGMLNVQQTASKIRNMNLDIKKIYTSPLVRSVQTAEEMGSELEMEIEPCDDLKSLDVGEYQGEPEQNNDIHYYMKHPSITIPEGESYSNFATRVLDFIEPKIKSDDICMIVGHSVIASLLDAKSKNDKSIIMKDCIIEPAGFMIIEPDYSISYVYNSDTNKQDDKQYA